MSRIARKDSSLERSPRNFTVEALAAVLPQAWVRDAIAASGRRSQRQRRLPAVLTVWMVTLLGLFRQLSYVNLLEMVFEAGSRLDLWRGGGAPPCSSALTKARDRLGTAPLRLLYERSATEWQDQTRGREFFGRRVVAMDGSTLKVPDTPENRAFFGAPVASRGRAAYPQLRIVGIRDVGTRLYRAVRFGPYSCGEMTLARDLIGDVEPGSILLADRGFASYGLLWDLYEKEAVDFLVRVKRDFRCRVVEQIAPGDAIVEVVLHRALRRRRPDLPKTWLLREITYRPPQGSETIRLFTTLLLAEEIARHELIDLYPDRWEEEVGYDEIKTHLCGCTTVNRPLVLRSKLPHRIEQELYGLLIAYNAVRITIARAAAIASCPPRRVSFVTALERIREAVRDMMQVAALRLAERYDRLMAAITRVLVPRRPGRSNPREVKIKMSNYPLKRPAPT